MAQSDPSFTFAGKAVEDFGLFFVGKDPFKAAVRNYTNVVVPGRIGELTYEDDSMNNARVPYHFAGKSGAVARSRDFYSYLLSFKGYQLMTDEDHFFLGRPAGLTDGTAGAGYNSAACTIEFDMMPQRWLYDGDEWQTVTSGMVLDNPTWHKAKPLIEVVGTGTVTIGDNSVTVNYNPNRMYIDAENEIVYDPDQGTNYGTYANVSGDFLPLAPGTNTITLTGFSATGNVVRIKPRYYDL